MKVSLKVSLKLVTSVDHLGMIVIATAVILGFYLEIDLRKQNWLICSSYNPNKHNISKHIEALSKSIDLFSSDYENAFDGRL